LCLPMLMPCLKSKRVGISKSNYNGNTSSVGAFVMVL
jgi:hypothetical protein